MKLHTARNFYFRILPKLLVFVGFIFLVLSFGPLIISEIWYYTKEWRGQEYVLDLGDFSKGSEHTVPTALTDSPFARFLSTKPVILAPKDKEFSIVIEKIGVNAPIVADVSVTDEEAYVTALKSGIAHSVTSNYPSEMPGNTYLFAHASLNFFQLGKYSTVFNLLRKLDAGDKIHIFYDNKIFEYHVVNKEVYKGWDTYPITRPVIEPILTLQTCDPPGTTINRMVVTAKLYKVYNQLD